MTLNSTQYARAREAFHKALTLQPAARAAWIESECSGDIAIRREVESLLAYHEGTPPPEPSLPEVKIVNEESRAGSLKRAFRCIFTHRAGRWALGGAVVAAMLGAGDWGRTRLRQTLLKEVGGHLESIANSNMMAVEIWAQYRFDEVKRWAADPRVIQMITDLEVVARSGDGQLGDRLRAAPAAVSLNELLNSAMRWGVYDHFVVFDQNYVTLTAFTKGVIGWKPEPMNDIVISISKALGGEDSFLARRRYGSSYKNQAPFSGPERFFSWFFVPVRGADGAVIAALGFSADAIKRFDPILEVGRWGDSGETYAVSNQGLLMSESRFREQLKAAGVLALDMDSSQRTVLKDPGGDLTQGFKPVAPADERPFTVGVQRLIASSRGGDQPLLGQELEPYRDYRGIPVIGAWHWSPNLDFGVLTEVDSSEALAIVRSIDLLYLVLAGVLIAAIVITLSVSINAFRRGPAARLGDRFGHYKLLRKIGEGGIGEVYLAKHELLKRATAIKVLRLGAIEAGAYARFELEVRATSRLTHPNTIAIYDFGRTAKGSLYYAMEYLIGITLAKLIELEPKLPAARAVYLLRQIAASLSEAHSLGLIHRDIKPLNIMVCRVGGEYDVVKVLDFGLVRNLKPLNTNELTTSLPGSLRGTPGYLPPEMLRDPSTAGVASDIYSLGVVAFKMLAGRNPFDAPNEAGLMFDILNTPPPSLAVLRPDLSPLLVDAIMACLEKSPARRPPSMAAFAELLAAAQPQPAWSGTDARIWWGLRDHLLDAGDA